MDWQFHVVGWRLDPDGWHPDIPIGATFGALDLRETRNLNSSNGVCVLATPLGFTELPRGAIKLADDPMERLSTARINALAGRLGLGVIDPPDLRFAEVMVHLLKDLGNDGRADRHNTLKPTSGRGHIEIRNGKRMAIRHERLSLGSRLIDREVSEYEFNNNSIVCEDNFSTGWTSSNEGLDGRTPDTTQPSSNVWDADAGWKRAASESAIRYDNTFNDEANIDCNILDGKVGIYYDPSGQNQDVWLTGRSGIGTANPDKYLGAPSYHSNNCRLRRVVSGSTSTIATVSSLGWDNTELGTHALEVDGSDLEVFYSASDTQDPAQYGTDIGASAFTGTDTNITTGDQWGISGLNRKANDHRVHRFWVDDLAAAAIYEDSFSLGLSQGLTQAPAAAIEAALSLAVSKGLSVAADALVESLVSLGTGHALAVSGGLETYDALDLGLQHSTSADNDATVGGQAGFGLTAGQSDASDATIEGQAALGLSQGVVAAAIVAAEASLNFALEKGFDPAGGLVLEDALTLALQAGQANTGGLSLQDSISLALSSTVAAATDVDVFAALALGLSPGLSQGATAVYEGAITLGGQAGFTGGADTVFDVAVTLSAQQALAATAAVSIEAAVTLAGQLAMAVAELSTSAQAPPFRTISVAADGRSTAIEADERTIKVSRDNRTIIISGD